MSKTNTFFSRFEGTRGEKTQIFRTKVVTLTTPNKQCTVTLLALPLQTEAVNLIETHQDLLKVTIFQSMADLFHFHK